jgi:hypothetical protein
MHSTQSVQLWLAAIAWWFATANMVVRYRRHAKHMDLLQRITTVHNLSKLCFVQKERPSGHLEESTVSGFERPRPELGLSDRSTADESLHDAYSTALFWVS